MSTRISHRYTYIPCLSLSSHPILIHCCYDFPDRYKIAAFFQLLIECVISTLFVELRVGKMALVQLLHPQMMTTGPESSLSSLVVP